MISGKNTRWASNNESAIVDQRIKLRGPGKPGAQITLGERIKAHLTVRRSLLEQAGGCRAGGDCGKRRGRPRRREPVIVWEHM